MSGGFGAGFVKGAFISLIGIGAISLAIPLGQVDPAGKTQVDLPTPVGSGFNAERTDTNPVLPVTSGKVVPTEAKNPQQKPKIAVLARPIPVPDTTPATQPKTPSVAALPKVALSTEKVAVITPPTDSAPSAKPPVLGLPMPAIDNPLAKVPSNNIPIIKPPVTQVTPPAPLSQDNSPTPAVTAVVTPNLAPNAKTAPSQTAPAPNSPKPIATAQTAAQTTPADKPQATAPKAAQLGALMRNRVGFDNPDAKPLMSIILIDVGSDGLDAGTLRSITFPVTFAIKSDAPEATMRAKILAQSGSEVLAVTPSGASEMSASENAADTTKALSKIFATIPEAVGLIDPISADLQSSPKLADEVIAALEKSGYGLLTYDIGLNPVDKKARHAGLASGVVFRVLDAERESGIVIKRYLNRAVVEAQKTGQVIVVGRTYPETVAALFSWALSAKSATVKLAPVSAALLAR